MRFSAVVLLVAALFIPSAVAQEAGSVESKIIAMEKAWNQAFKFRDRKALSEIFADGVVIVNDDGSLLTKSAFLSIVENQSFRRATSLARIHDGARVR